ncbi:hypothetical protein PTTG_07662 [Puccinia triticina 1-1 BBBD Race 1]|uniref:MMtag domain-containing protein n=1 Tax=Puccinia triticina (isolate 1-1 / race 1 (BBBD)) TaxID=630390 RepID=A0A180GJQ2_PUCT1|nr:hypothetical protein PTTG_07662 [Puccinia triticina 1-1 BBBD Race 1]
MFSGPIRGGTRGGQGDFKWSDVADDKDRENYLGHSILAPVGRWQKNKDITWYNKDGGAIDEDERMKAKREEIKRIKAAEEDALSAALGFKPAPRDPMSNAPETSSNAIPLGPARGGGEKQDDRDSDGEEDIKRRKEEKAARKAERAAKRERKLEEKMAKKKYSKYSKHAEPEIFRRSRSDRLDDRSPDRHGSNHKDRDSHRRDRDSQHRDRDSRHGDRDSHYKDRDSHYKDRDSHYKDRDSHYKDRDSHYKDRDSHYKDRDSHSKDCRRSPHPPGSNHERLSRSPDRLADRASSELAPSPRESTSARNDSRQPDDRHRASDRRRESDHHRTSKSLSHSNRHSRPLSPPAHDRHKRPVSPNERRRDDRRRSQSPPRRTYNDY